MQPMLLETASHHRSPASLARLPTEAVHHPTKGEQHPADPATAEEIVAVMR